MPGRSSILLLFVVLLLSGCNHRAVVKPRSEMIEQARSNGIRMRSNEEERARFFEAERTQKRRLLALLRSRAGERYRDPTYRVGAGDDIEINVFDVPELNVTAKARDSGFISLPLIGAIKAVGRTESDLLSEISSRLKTYVRDPQVSVFVAGFGSQKIAVMGAVSKPGTYPIRKGANSILELVGEAGGLSEKAGNIVTFIPAELSGLGSGSDVEARARLSLAAYEKRDAASTGIELFADQVLGLNGGIPIEVPVRGGDMIVVPEAGQIMIEGEVEKPGSIEIGQRLSLLSALAASGGITYAAKVDEVEIIRPLGSDEKASLVVDLAMIADGREQDIRLRSGDIVRVPSHSGRRLTQDTFDGISQVINFGVGGNVNLVK